MMLTSMCNVTCTCGMMYRGDGARPALFLLSSGAELPSSRAELFDMSNSGEREVGTHRAGGSGPLANAGSPGP